jgi:hypothetical protein
VHLDLSENQLGPDGAESLAGVLGQCPALAHLDLQAAEYYEIGYKKIGSDAEERQWRGPSSGLVLYEGEEEEEEEV